MARAGNKSVRFTKVVEQSGEPRVHTLWLPPDKDPELQRAEKAHRVLTIESGSNGGKADVGRVGFKSAVGTHAQFLIFPKSLKRFEGAHVVGIKFDLVAQPELASVDPLKHTRTPPARVAGKRPSSPGPAEPRSPLTAEPDESATTAPDNSAAPEAVKGAPEQPSRKRKERVAAAPPKQRPPIVRVSSRKAKNEPARQAAPPAPTSPSQAALLREIRAAMKDLQRGKSVAAYQRLERVISKAGTNG